MRPALLVCAVGLLLSGCGGSSKPAPSTTADGSSAKSLFVSQCGSCHRLREAGTEGVVGTDLDALRPSAAAVLRAIREGPRTMPPGLLSGAEARRVAAYVARAAGAG